MNLRKLADEVDVVLGDKYLEFVVEGYKPLFNRLFEKAEKYMLEACLQDLFIGPGEPESESSLFYRVYQQTRPGFMINSRGLVKLEDLPDIFQRYVRKNCSEEDEIPNVHTAMRLALLEFERNIAKAMTEDFQV